MATHRVRFDEETEEALQQVCRAMAANDSFALKRGILSLRDGLRKESKKPFDIYRRLPLGSGGHSDGPARFAKSGVADVIRRKHHG